MSGKMPSKHSRSPGRRHSGERRSPGRNDRFQRREPGSPDRQKRSRWESPSRSHKNESDYLRSRRRDIDSPPLSRRKGFESPPRARRTGFDDGYRSEHLRIDEEVRRHSSRHDDHRGAAQGPAGLVFLCSSATQRDCFDYRVFGLPLPQREIVERVLPGTKLFLFNLDTKELFGIFEAVSPGGIDLVPEAFQDFKGSYAAQVRFRILRECFPLPDEVVKDVLKENLSQRGKFDCELNADQVFQLTDLFTRSELRLENAGPRMGMGPRDIAMGVGSMQDRAAFPHVQGFHYLEKNDVNLPPNRIAFPEAHVLANRGDPAFLPGGKLPSDGGYVNAAAILGPGMVEEVDRIALKYLQNDPGFAGVHLEPLDPSLFSNASGYIGGDPSKSGLENPEVGVQQHPGMRLGPNFGGLHLQLGPQPDLVSFPGPRAWNPNMQPPSFGGPFPPASGVGLSEMSFAHGDAKVHPAGPMLDMARKEPATISHEKGLLPLPGGFPHIPPQPGMVPPFPAGVTGPLMPGSSAGPSMAVPSMPFHPSQPHMMGPNAVNHHQASPKPQKKRDKRNKNKKKNNQPNQKAAGVDESKKESQPAAGEAKEGQPAAAEATA